MTFLRNLQGKDAVPFLEQLVVGDIAGIPNGAGSLSMFTNEHGGIIDDTVVTKVGTGDMVLVNPVIGLKVGLQCHKAVCILQFAFT